MSNATGRDDGAYVQTHLTETLEQGTRDGLIIAACVCGSGLSLPDKGLGRAAAATWRTRHQDCTRSRTEATA